MAPMAVPSHRLRTGTVAWDGIPTAAAVAPPPPPTIAGDLCACIPGPTSRSTFFLPAPMVYSSRAAGLDSTGFACGIASTPPSAPAADSRCGLA